MSGNGELVYVAGPLFNEGERWWIEQIAAVVEKAGFSTFVPHRDNPAKTPDNTRGIFLNDKGAIDRCVAVVADLNGTTTDDGTAWELGYAFAIGKPAVGLFTDGRGRYHDPVEVVNLMMQFSMNRIVRSLDDVLDALLEAIASGPPSAKPTI